MVRAMRPVQQVDGGVSEDVSGAQLCEHVCASLNSTGQLTVAKEKYLVGKRGRT